MINISILLYNEMNFHLHLFTTVGSRCSPAFRRKHKTYVTFQNQNKEL